MIYLDTNDKIQQVSSVAANLDTVVSYIDVPDAGGTAAAATQKTNHAAATTVDICAVAPGSNHRAVRTINIRNKHATTSTDVTVTLLDNATTYELHKATLDPGECLEYVEGIGWFLIENPFSNVSRCWITSNLSAWTTTTLADATGLLLPVINGGYYNFKFWMLYQSAATTTGIKCSVTVPSVTQFAAVTILPVSTAAGGTSNIFYDHITTSGDAVTGTGTPAATTTHLAMIEGTIVPAADGNVQLQGASEVAASNVTLQQGSQGRIERFA